MDEYGCLVFPATVKRVESDGRLVLEYDHCKGEEFVEWAQDVNPRVQMPWHPKKLRKNLRIRLMRNIGHGQVLEGLEIRWDVVSNILQALTKLGRWRLDTKIVGPMHQWYDKKLFDVMELADIREQYAPKVWDGQVLEPDDARKLAAEGLRVTGSDARTAAELLGAGLHVSFADESGRARGEVGAGEGAGAVDAVDREVFL